MPRRRCHDHRPLRQRRSELLLQWHVRRKISCFSAGKHEEESSPKRGTITMMYTITARSFMISAELRDWSWTLIPFAVRGTARHGHGDARCHRSRPLRMFRNVHFCSAGSGGSARLFSHRTLRMRQRDLPTAGSHHALLRRPGLYGHLSENQHPKTFLLYDRLETVIGNCTFPNDNGVHMRVGRIYRLPLQERPFPGE